jgi:hypothetical protein
MQTPDSGCVAEAWEEPVEDLDIVNGVVISYKSEKEMPLKNLVVYGLPKPGGQGWMGRPVVGRGNFMPTYVTGLDAETGQGERAVVHYTTGAQAVEWKWIWIRPRYSQGVSPLMSAKRLTGIGKRKWKAVLFRE